MNYNLALGLAILALIAASMSFFASRYQISVDNYLVYRLDAMTGEIRAYKLDSHHGIPPDGFPDHVLKEEARTK